MKNIVLVIGGSSGVGNATCIKLKDEYHVINMSRNNNNNVDNIYCDVTNIKSVEDAFEELKNKYGIPYGLIYCSGFVEIQSIFETTEKILEKTFQTNILGAFRCVKEYVKLNKKGYGTIVLIASTAGTRPSAGWDAYASSKAALINFGATLSEELGSNNKKVYTLSLGRCNTPLREILDCNENKALIMQPDEVANVIENLLNDDGLLDGQNIIVRKNKFNIIKVKR